MKPVRQLLLGLALGLVAQPALAFQETTVGGGGQGAPAAAAIPAPPPSTVIQAPKTIEPNKGLQLSTPEVSIGGKGGTEVRIPGIGTVGVLPKLDFGLELLYGATESKIGPDTKSEPSDVQIRGTIKHRF